MFKKTILASSLAALTTVSYQANAAMALTAITTDVTHTKQGLMETATTGAAVSNTDLTLGAEYAVGDTITFTSSVAFSTETPVAPPTSIACQSAAANTDIVNLGLMTETSTALTYRVISLTDGSAVAGVTTVGAICVTPVVELSDSALASAGSATLTVSGATSGGAALDAPSSAANGTQTVATAVEEYTSTTGTALNGIVDVNQDRKAFTTLTSTNSADQLVYTVAASTGVAGERTAAIVGAANATIASIAADVSTITGIVTTISGDFSFLDTDTTTTGMQLGTNTVTSSGGAVTWGTDLQSLIITDSNNALAAETLTITKVVADTVLPVQTYTGNTVITYGTNQTASVAVATPGAWTLNGANITIYSMPFGSNIDQFMWVSNTGASAGEVTATVTYEGTTYPATGSYSLGNAGARSNTKVDDDLATAMTAAGDSITSGRADVAITVNAPVANIQVYGGYKVVSADDRLNLETSSSLD